MKKFLKTPSGAVTLGGLAVYVLTAVILAANWKILPNDELIIQFTANEGIKFLGTKTDIVSIFAVSGILIAANLLLAKEIFFKERVLGIALIWGSALLSIFTLVAIGLIISVN